MVAGEGNTTSDPYILGTYIVAPLSNVPTLKIVKDLTLSGTTPPTSHEKNMLTTGPPTIALSEDLMLFEATWVGVVNLCFNGLFMLIHEFTM